MFTRNDFHYFIEPLSDPEEETKIKKKMITLIETVHDRLPRNLRELLHPGISKLSCEWGYLSEKEPPVYSVHYNVVIGFDGISVGVAIESVKLIPKFLEKLAKNRDQFSAILRKCKDCKLRIFYGLKKGKSPKPTYHDTVATFDTKYVDETVVDFLLQRLKWKRHGKRYPRLRLYAEIDPIKILNLEEAENEAVADEIVDIIKMLEPYFHFVRVNETER